MKQKMKKEKNLNIEKLKFIKEASVKHEVQFGACSMYNTCYSKTY